MPKILIVEDEPNLLELYTKEMQDEGYEVLTAMDGEVALDLVKKQLPDLVILDIKIRKIDGLKVLHEIKEFHKDIPVILNSAYETFKSDFSSWIADAYLVKTSNLDQLKLEAKRLLQLN
jgi:DNA-binding response OmpR family regulator